MPRRCELGCPYNSSIPYHQFPNMEKNLDRFKAWVHVVGGKLENDNDYFYYKKKVICDIHFTTEDKNRNNRLNCLAIPSLHLSGVVTMDVEEQQEQYNDLTSAKAPVDVTATPGDSSSALSLVPTKRVTPFSSLNEHYVTDKYADIKLVATEHNYCRSQEKTVSRVKRNEKKVTPSVIADQLRFSRKKIKELQTEIIRLRNKNQSFKARLESAEKIGRSNYFKILTQNMTEAAKIFTKMQYMQTQKKPGGRRFSLKEKILSLSIYKRSPKSYTLLSKYFTLPSPKSMKRLLSQLELDEGLNKQVFVKIKQAVKEMSPEDRLVSLIFDEMSITPSIRYDAHKDKLRGLAFNKKSFADHVLVFMVKGIKKKFKQPVAYYFTNCLNKYKLEDIIIKVIKYVKGTGLNVLCTVCDQSTINVSALNVLINKTKEIYVKKNKEWRNDVFQVGNSEIIPLFDVPHLIKGLRNNLLSKDLVYFDFEDKIEKTVKWEYYQKVYEADKSYGELKLLQKLTDEHIYREKIRKMKVKAATQVFSHSVAVVTEHLTARGDLPKECRNLIKFTKMIDNLFDSLNSNTFHIPNGKIYKGCVKRNSPHHQLWNDAIKMLKSIKFIKIEKTKNNKVRLVETSNIPSVQNFIKTIEGIKNLWCTLTQKYSFDAMLTRNFNQDPLENFFGNIRSFGVRNIAPDTVGFEGAYKSLLLNNFNIPHSSKANCENDENHCLQNIDFFIKENGTSCVPEETVLFPNEEHNNVENIVLPCINLSDETVDAGQGNYVCGWVLTKCLKKVSKSCKVCRTNVLGDETARSNDYIRTKEYQKKSLLYPSKNISKCFTQIQNIVHEILKRNVPKNDLKKTIKMFTNIFVEYPFECKKHKEGMINYFEDTVINVLIHSWCLSINRILAGKITYDGDDEMKSAAQLYRNKHSYKSNSK